MTKPQTEGTLEHVGKHQCPTCGYTCDRRTKRPYKRRSDGAKAYWAQRNREWDNQVLDMRKIGFSEDQIAARMGIKRKSLDRTVKRHGL